ncbi:MAG: TIGR01906 family membrane protein [Chloroflexota bacterium]|nr:TIGR01906 family membrane protein [Chloroflexota bacterium]
MTTQAALAQDKSVTVRPTPGTSIASRLLPLLVPLLLVLINVRIVMSPLWLQIEYHRPGFPIDPFGFTLQDRLTYAPYAIDYLIYNHDLSYLGDLTFPNGLPLYNERELKHMYDVQVVTQWAFIIALAAGVIASACALLLWRRDRARLWVALRVGALLTLGGIVGIILFALVGWDVFFTGFHNVFFENGTWYFLTSDTLIRLFPEQFWFDTAIVIGGLSALQAGFLYLILRRR